MTDSCMPRTYSFEYLIQGLLDCPCHYYDRDSDKDKQYAQAFPGSEVLSEYQDADTYRRQRFKRTENGS